MKKLLIAALLFTPFLVSQSNAAPKHRKRIHSKKTAQSSKKTTSQVRWLTSYAAGLAEAKRTGKPIFMDFYTTWCGPCKYLDTVTYRDPQFIAESSRWVMVKINAEQDNTNVQLTVKNRIEGYPTMLFLTSSGKEAGRAVGGYPAQLLIPQMRRALPKALGAKAA